jgi:hypothetical protein
LALLKFYLLFFYFGDNIVLTVGLVGCFAGLMVLGNGFWFRVL